MKSDISPPVSDPIFVLSLPLSFSSYFAAMLGQHPELYSLPEMHLLVGDINDVGYVTADSNGKFTFTGVPKPDVVPDTPAPEMASEPVVSKGSSVSSSSGSSGPQDGGGTASAVG